MRQRNSFMDSKRLHSSLMQTVRAVCVGAMIAASAATGRAQSKPAAAALRIYFVDTEGGQATLFVLPNHTSLLVDTGFPRPNARDADRIVRAAKLAGVERIDYLLLTHYHRDHIGGLADLVTRIPIGTFIDHGPKRDPNLVDTPQEYANYQSLLQSGKYKHLVAKAGDKLPIAGIDITVVSADGKVIRQPLTGAATHNAECDTPDTMPADIDLSQDVENGLSVGIELNFGKVRILDLGDLTWDHERELMCPANKLGHINLLVVSHHGSQPSNSPIFFSGITPQVAIMGNGERKGGIVRVFDGLRNMPNKPDIWQLHYAILSGDHNVDPSQIANLSTPEAIAAAAAPRPAPGTPRPAGPPPPQPPDDNGYMITVEAQPSGAFTIINERTGKSHAYVAK